MNKIENKKYILSTKLCYLKKLTELRNSRLRKKDKAQVSQIRISKRDIITHTTEVQKIIKYIKNKYMLTNYKP
jgi:hypothetical protein